MREDKTSFVYKAVDENSGKILYIGITKRSYQTRWREHIRSAKKLIHHSKRELMMALYIKMNRLKFKLVKKRITQQRSQQIEKRLIEKYRPIGNTTYNQ